METLGGMQTAAIAGMVNKAKMVAAAVPGSTFENMEIPGQSPGTEPAESKALGAAMDKLGSKYLGGA